MSIWDGVGAQGVHVHRAGTRWVVRADCPPRSASVDIDSENSDSGNLGSAESLERTTRELGIVEEADDLLSALVLADLLSADLAPGPRPPRSPDIIDEAERLRVAVRQLEHALAARVTVEQAIGVIAERGQVTVRD